MVSSGKGVVWAVARVSRSRVVIDSSMEALCVPALWACVVLSFVS